MTTAGRMLTGRTKTAAAAMFVAAVLIWSGLSRPWLAAQTALTQATLEQIGALLQEKEQRSPVERKLDSQLVYALKMSRGQAIAAGVARLDVDLPKKADGRLTLDLIGTISDTLVATIRGLNVDVVDMHPEAHSMQVVADLDRVEAIARLPEIRFVQPKQDRLLNHLNVSQLRRAIERVPRSRWMARPAATWLGPSATAQEGSVMSEGDVTHRVGIARGIAGADGSGVKIGVLSDGIDGLAGSQASGDLGPVTILPGQAGAGSEGTALLEVIHDLAPGAQLYFATADPSLAAFAANIRALRAVGCDIIVDDILYFVESPFQDGQAPSIVANTNGGLAGQAVKDVVADGALYFSAAGNGGNITSGTAGVWEGDFVDGGPAAPVFPTSTARLHSFGASALNHLLFPGSRYNLSWSDPLGGSANDYDLLRVTSSGSIGGSAANIQSGTQDPYEELGTFINFQPGDSLVIIKKTTAAPRYLHLDTNGGELEFATPGAIRGHAATTAVNALAVAATPAAEAIAPGEPVGPFPNPFNATNVIESYSSDGPRRLFYRADGLAITPGDVSSTGGLLINKPDVTAADGVSVTGIADFPERFYGTSASVAHAGAIAALLKSSNRTLTPADIRARLMNTAIDIGPEGPDRDSGAGIVMADAAVLAGTVRPSFRLHPLDRTAISGSTLTFQILASGAPAPSLQWQRSTDGGATWTNLIEAAPYSGVTTAALTVTNVTIAVNGNRFRCMATNVVGGTASSSAVLTVQAAAAPVFTRQPTNQSVDMPGTATFMASVSGSPSPQLQWRVSADGGSTWSGNTQGFPFTGAAGDTLAVDVRTQALDGYQFRLYASNASGFVTSDVATLTVRSVPLCSTGAPVYALFEGFEGPVPTWIGPSTAAGTWSRSSVSPRNGSWAAHGSDVASASDHSLISPPVVVPAGGRLAFDHSFAFETPRFDGGVVELTLDDGNSWIDAASFIDAGQGYNGRIANTFPAIPLANRLAFTSASGTYVTTRLNLQSFAGQTVRFRFHIGTDSSVGADGWSIDNIALYSCSTDPAAPTLTNPGNQVAEEATTARFTVTPSGLPAPAIAWQISTDGGANWTNLVTSLTYGGVNTPSLIVSYADLALDGTKYRAVATNASGSFTSQAATLTVVEPGVPVFIEQPINQSVINTGRAVFAAKAEASGGTPSLQWQLSTNGGSTWSDLANAAPYSGVTTNTLTITNATVALHGNLYRAVAALSDLSTSSDAATLMVAGPSAPVFLVQPVDATVPEGTTVTFLAVVTGVPAPSYLWETSADGGTTWTSAGSIQPTLDVGAGDFTNGKKYRLKATNTSGTTISNVVTLTMAPLQLCPTGQPNYTFFDNFEAPNTIWTANTDGTGNWTRTGSFRGTYSAFATTGTSGQSASDIRLTSSPLLIPPQGRLYFDQNSIFSSFTGGVIEYSTDGGNQWYDAGALIDGGNAYRATLTPPALVGRRGFFNGALGGTRLNLASLAGQRMSFRFRVATDTNGFLRWFVDNFSIYSCGPTTPTAPVIVAQPVSQTTRLGDTLYLEVKATGNPAPTYQWQLSSDGGTTWSNIIDNHPYHSPTTSSLEINSPQPSVSGTKFRCIVTNANGSVQTDVVTLTVLDLNAPVPTIHPVSQSVVEGGTATFTAGSPVTAGWTIQWQVSSDGGVTWTNLQNGLRYSGVNTLVLNVTGVTIALNGNQYRVTQSNAFGSSVSLAATLTLVGTSGNLIANGTFSSGLANWFQFSLPDQNAIVSAVTAGVFRFFQVPPPPGQPGQAVVFQETGQPVLANQPLVAEFDIGNTSSVRKRISVLVLDGSFSDLSVCTFWLPPGAPLRTYRMRTHTTRSWSNAALYFYAATSGENGGSYLLDNVSLRFDAAQSSTRTDCLDPTTPLPNGGGPGPNLLVNGDFSGGTGSWGPFSDISFQVAGGVFEFIRPGTPGQPAGGVLQATGQAMTANQILTSSFQLGNSSGVRKRVTAIVHDLDFSDLSACTFWLPPGQPLSTYEMRMATTKAWTNATISFYAATTGLDQWTRLDNVTLQRTPGDLALGTECVEPTVIGTSIMQGAVEIAAPVPFSDPRIVPDSRSTPLGSRGGQGAGDVAMVDDGFTLDGATGWRADAWTTGRAILRWAAPIEIEAGSGARLQFASWLSSRVSTAAVQVSIDGVTWETVASVQPSDDWGTIDVDLGAFAGQTIYLRFVFDAVAPGMGIAHDWWRIDDLVVRRGS